MAAKITLIAKNHRWVRYVIPLFLQPCLKIINERQKKTKGEVPKHEASPFEIIHAEF
jgi:hypothetical protein